MSGDGSAVPPPQRNPFAGVVECPWGPLSVVVVRREEVRIRTLGLVEFCGTKAVAKGTLKRMADKDWVLFDYECVAAAGGRTFEAIVGADRASVFREAMVDAAVEHLSANERLLVEADLIDVFRIRKERVAEVAAVQNEIDRRNLKINVLRARNEREAEGLARREAAIRAELASMRSSEAGVASGPAEVDHDVGVA